MIPVAASLDEAAVRTRHPRPYGIGGRSRLAVLGGKIKALLVSVQDEDVGSARHQDLR